MENGFVCNKAGILEAVIELQQKRDGGSGLAWGWWGRKEPDRFQRQEADSVGLSDHMKGEGEGDSVRGLILRQSCACQ